MSINDFEFIYQPIPPDRLNENFASALEDVVARGGM